MNSFQFDLPTKIDAGIGNYRKLNQHLKQRKRTLIVTDEGLLKTGIVDKVETVLKNNDYSVDIFSEVEPNPDEDLVNKLTDYIVENKIKQVIALGGGSPIDTAKVACCMAANEGPLSDYQWGDRSFANKALPLIVIPTTAGTGSEVTGVAVITSRETKKGVVDQQIFPDVAIVDAEMMESLPPYLTAITGMDALTHAVEAYIGLNSNSMMDSLAKESIRLIGEYLPQAYANGKDLKARYNLAKASTMAGIAMDQAGLGIVHSMASPMCAYLHLSHGLANSILLPYGMEFNRIACQQKMKDIAELLGGETDGLALREAAKKAINRVYELQEDLGLKEVINNELDVEVDLDKFGENAANMFLINNNPRTASIEACKGIFNKIFNQN